MLDNWGQFRMFVGFWACSVGDLPSVLECLSDGLLIYNVLCSSAFAVFSARNVFLVCAFLSWRQLVTSTYLSFGLRWLLIQVGQMCDPLYCFAPACC